MDTKYVKISQRSFLVFLLIKFRKNGGLKTGSLKGCFGGWDSKRDNLI